MFAKEGDMTETIKLIKKLLKNGNLNNYQNISDLFDLIRMYEEDDHKHAHKLNKTVRNISSTLAKRKTLELEERERFYQLYKRSLLFDALDDFDAFILYVEFDRKPEKQFYAPRRFVLKTVVQDLQDLHDRKIKFLAVSLPPRVGKSTLGIFFLSWLIGKYPELHNLMTGYGGDLTEGFQSEVYDIMTSSDYLWHDVFPGLTVLRPSIEKGTINIDKKRRFASLTCRSILGQLTGTVDINGLAYIDDVIEDIEEALNPARMDKKYSAYLNQVKDRKIGDPIELHIGTRWNVNDVIGRLKDLYGDNPEYRFRVIPALNENDESNFDYDKNRDPSFEKIGFSTERFRDMRRSLEDAGEIASWHAKYQGEPYVREGLVFPEDCLKTFNGIEELPSGEPIIYIACDVAWGGGDSLSAPIAYVYGNDVYIVDWLFSKGDKNVTRPQVEAKIINHRPQFVRFEANNGGDMYAEDIENNLRDRGYRFNIESRTTTGGMKANKHSEILAFAPDIRNFYFLTRGKRSSDYNNAIKELCRYIQNGKVKNDDAADSLKQLARMILEGSGSYEIGDRLF